LDDVAKSQNLSPNYLASFFKNHIGMTYLNYLNSIRLESARKDLISTELFITDIALNNGFPNVKAFNKVFKETYNATPNLYRSERKITNSSGIFNYLQIDDTKVFASLEKYMLPLSVVSSEKYYPIIKERIEVNAVAKGKKLNHSWKSLITFGRASDGLSSEIQKQLTEMQREIGFKYVRFHGLLDDSMLVYNMNKSNYQFNFNRVFELFDFLLSINLKPFAGISFMPSQLAKEQKSIFIEKSIISMPKNIETWCELIKSLLRSCILRYGLDEVSTWYFEFWNEPETLGFMWNNSVEDYLTFYKSTYDAVKSVDTSLKFGGPACFAETILNDSWFNSWFDTYSTFVKINHCNPDFFSIHAYPILPKTTTNELSVENIFEYSLSDNKRQLITMSPDVDYLENTLIKVKSALEKHGFTSTSIFMTEWNSTIWHRDLCSDTCYKAAYLVKNITENMDKIDSFGFWTISDRMEELFPASTLFHGGLGLMTYNGVKKPGYYAYTLLNKLGNQLLESGKGYFLTRNEKLSSHNLQILLYNYCHFDDNYRNMDSSYVSQSDRYNVFINENETTINLNIKGFPNGRLRIKETRISRKNGSAYDKWLDMGHPEMLSPDDLHTLKMLSVPSIKIKEKTIGDSFELNCSLLPHEVVLFEILSQ
jgi:xylan 1,4-beta-xylosidase